MKFDSTRNPQLNFVLALFLLCGFPIGINAQDTILPNNDRFHLFLLIGQSNMAGRGKVEQQDKTPHPRVLMLNKTNQWVAAIDPIHFDKPAAGVGLGKTFGQIIAETNPSISVGLIPCAVGGSPLDSWKPGVLYAPTNSYPWDDAIRRTKDAMQYGELKGILWHQGESDSKPELAESYETRLRNMIVHLRESLNAPKVPFIVGQLGQFDDVPWDASRNRIDAAHQSIGTNDSFVGFVRSKGLKHGGDKVHFDATSLREFGKRYADEFLRLQSNQISK